MQENVKYTKDGKQIKRHYVIGLVSFGRGCAHPDHPGFYAKVSGALDWINNVALKSNGVVDTTPQIPPDRLISAISTIKGVNSCLRMSKGKNKQSEYTVYSLIPTFLL